MSPLPGTSTDTGPRRARCSSDPNRELRPGSKPPPCALTQLCVPNGQCVVWWRSGIERDRETPLRPLPPALRDYWPEAPLGHCGRATLSCNGRVSLYQKTCGLSTSPAMALAPPPCLVAALRPLPDVAWFGLPVKCSADYGLGSVWVSAMIWSGATCPPSTNIRFASQRCATPRAVRLPASRARSALQLGTSLCMSGLLKLVLNRRWL